MELSDGPRGHGDQDVARSDQEPGTPTVAAVYGLSVEQAQEQMERQGLFSDFVDEFGSRFPEVFAGSVMRHHEGGRLTLLVTDSGVTHALPSGLSSYIDVQEVQYSLRALERIRPEIAALIPSGAGYVRGVDIAKNQVQVILHPTKASAALIDQTRAGLRASFPVYFTDEDPDGPDRPRPG